MHENVSAIATAVETVSLGVVAARLNWVAPLNHGIKVRKLRSWFLAKGILNETHG